MRPKKSCLPYSQSRVDLILASTPFISLFRPNSTHINHSFNVTNHRPVSTCIAVPNNPINIYNIPNSKIFYRALSKHQLIDFHNRLEPLNTWMHHHNTEVDSSPINELALLAMHTFSCLVKAYKLTTGQGHPHKPTSVENFFTSAILRPNNSTINASSTKRLQSLINNWKQKKQKQLHKRLHHSLIASKNIKEALRNIHNTNSSAPISL